MTAAAPPTKDLRRFREPFGIWGVVFLVFAGPLNPAAWIMGHPKNTNIILTNYDVMAWIIVMPTTIIALTMLNAFRTRLIFNVATIWNWGGIGFLFGTIAGPIGLLIHDVIQHGIEWHEILPAILAFLGFGFLFGIIPFFAFNIGLPCAIVAIAVGYLCSEPVD
ncbi:hypothetical protein L0666_14830 [Octadecabacter sp. CECT 8868]|uniref:hypothetical protein n=1 Tax=Octadecabacter algicola TaxID=2909342 RepID=UPI001F436269|nr:hypothetical protein [Octadecabacter algicola]MCF2906269.1 hypothetical protein [Octadecabacter algicola]